MEKEIERLLQAAAANEAAMTRLKGVVANFDQRLGVLEVKGKTDNKPGPTAPAAGRVP